MNAPQEFQGTSGEVTVPLSAARRDRLVAASPRLANSARNTRDGSTRAMYWSPATTLSPKPQANTVTYSRPVLVADRISGSTRRAIKPNSSSNAPKVTAPTISHSVSSMLSMPPRDSSWSISPIPESIVNPLAIARQIPLIEPTSGL
jgi:hypothetical protein